MKRVCVRFEPDGVIGQGQEGDLLLDLALSAGIPILTKCGRQGSCGSCGVIARAGLVATGDSEQGREVVSREPVLACRTRILGDAVVEVPAQARLLPQDAETGGYLAPRAAAYLAQPTQGRPLAREVTLTLPPPSLHDPTPDLERLCHQAQEVLGGDRLMTISLEALRQLPLALRDASFTVTATVADEGCLDRVISVRRPNGHPPLGLAVDIGTSTVKAQLVSLEDGRMVAGASQYNAQVAYGEDVISRIIWAQEHEGGAADLRSAAILTVNQLAEGLLRRINAAAEQVLAVSVAGNATMICLLLGVPPDTIRRAPHVAPMGLPPVLAAQTVGIAVHPQAPVFCVPAINGYVGGDITAGVLATGLFADAELTLLVDVGTNGEVVVGNRDWMICCACSAGPAFEGMGIECGLPARPGAVEGLEYDPRADSVAMQTIADAPAVGLCGNGLVETLASLHAAGVVDRAGHLEADFPSDRVARDNGELAFVLARADETAGGRQIALRQSEIENLIRAKAAVYAAVDTLLVELGLSMDRIERFYLAGAFGSHLDIGAAVRIGLLPDMPRERVKVVGNTALVGAHLCLMSSAARDEVRRIARAVTYFDLSESARFMEQFIAAQMLPHTELERFPSVA